MENHMPTLCLPSSKQLAIIPFHQHIIPQNIDNQPQVDDEESGCMRKLFFSKMDEFHGHYTTDTTEQLLITAFYWVMISTSHTYLVMGFELLEKTGLSSSMHPLVMFLFKYSFAVFASLSPVYVYYFPLKNTSIIKQGGLFGTGFGILLVHILFPIIGKYGCIVYYFSDILYMSCVGGFSLGKHGCLVNVGLYGLLHTIVFPIGIRINMSSDLVLLISILTSFSRAASLDLVLLTPFVEFAPLFCFLDKRIKNLLPIATTRAKLTLKEKMKIVKFIKYAIGLGGTLVFQNFFRLTTFEHVKAFMYLATSWLASLTLINASHDFGFLNFMLGNMILGSTVSQSGLGITTWFTYCVCIFLYILGFMLKSTRTSQDLAKFSRPPVIFWVFYCCTIFDCVHNVMHKSK